MTGSTGALRKLPAGARVRIAREQISQLRGLNRQIDALAGELAELVKAHRPQLLAEQGCGALTAAILIGHTAGVKQFRKRLELRAADRDRADPLLLRPAHPAPAQPRRGPPAQPRAAHHRDHPRPTRPATKEYLARKEAEGKTNKGALRSLKRHLARRFYQLLAEPPADQPQAANGKPTVEPEPPAIPARPRPQREVQQIQHAPNPMVCIS